MIIERIDNARTAYAIHPLMERLFDYLRTHDLRQMSAGRITIEGDDLFINLGVSQLRTREEQKLETHKRYIDVHLPLDGTEIIGWRPLATTESLPLTDHNEASDFWLWDGPAESYFALTPDEFCVMGPGDAHAPIIGEGSLLKAVAKIRVM